MGMEKAMNAGPESNRKNWSSGLEFLLSCISISIGLGNVWRFPNLAYENGGGAFLIPYFIILVLVSKPLYYMELAFGQFAGKSPVKVWACVPCFKGIGIAQLLSTFFLTVYYNYIMAISLFYMFASMQSQLPWSWCDPNWADEETCFSEGRANASIETSNISYDSAINNVTYEPAPLQYFRNYVMKDSGSLEAMSIIDWRMMLCLLLSWTIVAISTLKGVQTLGKVVYLTSTYPYLVLISLLILALTQKGSIEGIRYFFTPQWNQLLNVQVWYKACEQSFFSLNTGFGHLIMYSSYNKFKHNLKRDAWIISIADTLTSILAGCVVFAILGTLAFELKQDISEVVTATDLRLVFVAYPEALAKIGIVPQLWAVLFFIMLFMLGLGSAIGHVESIITTIKDEIPRLHDRKSTMAVCVCTCCFISGLPLVTDSGQYVMTLFNNYGVGAAVFLYGILEIVGVMWIYGWKNFCSDIHYMLGVPVGRIWKVIWAFVSPLALIIIYVYGTVVLIIKGTDATKGIPQWGLAIGWIFAATCIIPIPIFFCIVVYQTSGTSLKEKMLNSFHPSLEWGPSDPLDRIGWLHWREQESDVPIKEKKNPLVYDNSSFQI